MTTLLILAGFSLAFVVIALLFSDDENIDKSYQERKSLGNKFYDKWKNTDSSK